MSEEIRVFSLIDQHTDFPLIKKQCQYFHHQIIPHYLQNLTALPTKNNIFFLTRLLKTYLTHNKQPNRSRQKMIYCVTIYSPLLLCLPRFYTRPKAPPLSTSARFISFHFISSNFISFLRVSFFGVDIVLIFISFGHLPSNCLSSTPHQSGCQAAMPFISRSCG